jgi:hypothetical protein
MRSHGCQRWASLPWSASSHAVSLKSSMRRRTFSAVPRDREVRHHWLIWCLSVWNDLGLRGARLAGGKKLNGLLAVGP